MKERFSDIVIRDGLFTQKPCAHTTRDSQQRLLRPWGAHARRAPSPNREVVAETATTARETRAFPHPMHLQLGVAPDSNLRLTGDLPGHDTHRSS